MSGKNISRLIVATTICIQSSLALSQTKPATSTSSEADEKSLAFETIKIDGNQFGHHEVRAQYVVRSQQEWDELRVDAQFRRQEASVVLPAKPPSVDFDTQIVLAVFMGCVSNTGYNVRITKVLERENKLIVLVRQRSPDSWSAPGPAFRYPSHLVRVARSNKPVCFQVMSIKHPKVEPFPWPETRIDPNIYKEFKCSPDGKALVWISLKEPELPPNEDFEKWLALIKEISEGVQRELGSHDFEARPSSDASTTLMGRINRKGLDKLTKNAHFEDAAFVGPFSLPEKWVIEQDCE